MLFWVIKVLTTGTGEAASDWFASVSLVLAGGLGALGFAVAMGVQFRTRRYVPAAYWFAVLMVAVFGTMAADALHKIVGIPYVITTAFYAVALAVVFVLWRRTEGTLSIHSIRTRRREIWYWLTVLLTFALGTAAGDLTAFVAAPGLLLVRRAVRRGHRRAGGRGGGRPEPGRRLLDGVRAHPAARSVVRRLARQVARARRPRLGRRRGQRGGDAGDRGCWSPTSRSAGTGSSRRSRRRTAPGRQRGRRLTRRTPRPAPKTGLEAGPQSVEVGGDAPPDLPGHRRCRPAEPSQGDPLARIAASVPPSVSSASSYLISIGNGLSIRSSTRSSASAAVTT